METIKPRKRDKIIIKIVDWSDDPKDCEPAVDVEIYINGEFDFHKSKVFSIPRISKNKTIALQMAKDFALEFLKK